MVNVRTLRGLRAALLECVPGKAQRGRLLEALARVPGNRHVSAVTAWLIAREADSPSQRASAGRIPEPPKSGVFRTQLVAYTQSPPEVNVTMARGTAENLLAALRQATTTDPDVHHDGWSAVSQLQQSLARALEAKSAAPRR